MLDAYPSERTAPMVAASARARTRRMLERLATGVKHCPHCDQAKPLTAFYATPARGGDRFSSWCQDCSNARPAERRARQAAAAERKAAEAAAAAAAARAAARKRHRRPVAPWPALRELPRMPDLSQGNCRKPGTDPDWWAPGATRLQQRAALASCGSCPVLAACEAYARQLLPGSTSGILGGIVLRTRRQQRLQRERAARP